MRRVLANPAAFRRITPAQACAVRALFRGVFVRGSSRTARSPGRGCVPAQKAQAVQRAPRARVVMPVERSPEAPREHGRRSHTRRRRTPLHQLASPVDAPHERGGRILDIYSYNCQGAARGNSAGRPPEGGGAAMRTLQTRMIVGSKSPCRSKRDFGNPETRTI
jgi:hypothetical protein